MHRTLAIMSFISPAVNSPNNLDFFLGDGVVDIVSVGNIMMTVCLSMDGFVLFDEIGGLLWCAKALNMGCRELLMSQNTVCWVMKRKEETTLER